ncbi:MAG: hypothetical protein ACOCSK_01040 [Rhodothermales bacterium]
MSKHEEVKRSTQMEKPYKPVNCDFYDELTARATVGKRSEIVYRQDGGEISVIDYIDDVYTEGDQEFARLREGTVVRLDQIERVDDESR